MEKEMDSYSDYLLSRFGQVTATALSSLLDGAVFHGKITRCLPLCWLISRWNDGSLFTA
jgi:hypothetical protein